MKHVNFGSIEQIDTVYRDIKHHARFLGTDENNKPIYNNNKLPKVNVILTEKIHGMNGGVNYSSKEGFYVQKRKSIISLNDDTGGFAFFCNKHRTTLLEFIYQLSREYKIDLSTHRITLFGEFAGGNIQSKSALSGLDKKYILFQYFKVSNLNPELAIVDTKWLETKINNTWLSSENNDIFNIMNFYVNNFLFDFNNYEENKKELENLVYLIEESSPVGEYFGKRGNVGEGVVGNFMYNNKTLFFKIKGKKHENTRVYKPKVQDNELMQRRMDCAYQICPAYRLEQFWQELFGIENENGKPSVKYLGDFIKKVIQDINKEELNKIQDFNFEPKDVYPSISKICQKWFLEQLENQKNNV